MRLMAIDPGPEQSAHVIYDTTLGKPLTWRKLPNPEMRDVVWFEPDIDVLAVEMIASYGMAVGAEVFRTCVEIGRLTEVWAMRTDEEPVEVFRRDVKLHLCGSARAKDPNVRQALIDRWGGKERAIGRKATPGPLYGLSGDCWAALGVAVTAAETRMGDERRAA